MKRCVVYRDDHNLGTTLGSYVLYIESISLYNCIRNMNRDKRGEFQNVNITIITSNIKIFLKLLFYQKILFRVQIRSCSLYSRIRKIRNDCITEV